MRIYGYCRTTSRQQSMDRQMSAIRDVYPDAVIYCETGEKETGGKREVWERLCREVKNGDTIVLQSVTRMAADADEGFRCYEGLFNNGISLVFLKEPYINTDTYKGALLNSVSKAGMQAHNVRDSVMKYLTALARDQIRLAYEQYDRETAEKQRRTREGIEQARTNGKQIGQKQGAKLVTQKSIRAKQEILELSKDFGGSLSDSECMQQIGLARNTFYKYKKELKKEEANRHQLPGESAD